MRGGVVGRVPAGRRGGAMEARGRDAPECASLPSFLPHADHVRTAERTMERDGVSVHGDEKTAGKRLNPTRVASMRRNKRARATARSWHLDIHPSDPTSTPTPSTVCGRMNHLASGRRRERERERGGGGVECSQPPTHQTPLANSPTWEQLGRMNDTTAQSRVSAHGTSQQP